MSTLVIWGLVLLLLYRGLVVLFLSSARIIILLSFWSGSIVRKRCALVQYRVRKSSLLATTYCVVVVGRELLFWLSYFVKEMKLEVLLLAS